MTATHDTPTAAGSGTAATAAFRDSLGRHGSADSDQHRVGTVAREILGRIHQVLREYQVSYPEYQAAKQWLIDVGESGEWPLFLDVFVEHVVEDVVHAGRQGTKGSIEGPYYLPGQAELPAVTALPMRPDEQGEPLRFEGRIRAVDGTPLPGARLDMWQADNDGYYSGFAPHIPDGNLRGVVTADDDGRFSVGTIEPAPYEIPKDGPTGGLIAAAGWHAWRPAHLHLIVTAPGHQPITTQLYFAGGKWLDSDIAQATKPELILIPQRDPDGLRRVRYDFVLDPA